MKSQSQNLIEKNLNKSICLPKEKEKFEPDNNTLKSLLDQWNIKLLDNIGFGGFSIVKLAIDEKKNEHYACKIVSSNKI